VRDQVGYEWLANTPRGDVYAFAPAKRGCAAGRSKTLSLGVTGEPGCPSDGLKCQIDISWREKHSGHCESWVVDTQYDCGGETTSATFGWHADADISWNRIGSSAARYVSFRAYFNEPQKILKGEIVGSGSATDHQLLRVRRLHKLRNEPHSLQNM
jgi:hypothetical protein